MKRRFTKMTGLALALVMLLSLAMPAFADTLVSDEEKFAAQLDAEVTGLAMASMDEDFINAEPAPDWGLDLEYEDWVIPEIATMEALDTDPELFGVDGVRGAAEDIIKDGMKKSMKGLISGKPVEALLDWGSDTILSWIFGDFDKPDPNAELKRLAKELSNQMEKGFNEMSAKLDGIKLQLDQVLEALKKVMDEATLTKYRNDVKTVFAQVDDMANVMRITRQDVHKAEGNARKMHEVMEIFNKTQISGTNVYLATMKLGDMLYTTKTNSGMDIFHISNSLSLASHFPWLHQEVAFYYNLSNTAMMTYVEMMAYCKLSLTWQIQNTRGTTREHYQSIYNCMFCGNSAAGIESNASKVQRAFDAAPVMTEDKFYDLLRYSSDWGQKFYIGTVFPAGDYRPALSAESEWKRKVALMWDYPNTPRGTIDEGMRYYENMYNAKLYLMLIRKDDWDRLKRVLGNDPVAVMKGATRLEMNQAAYPLGDSVFFNTYESDIGIGAELYNPKEDKITGRTGDILLFTNARWSEWVRKSHPLKLKLVSGNDMIFCFPEQRISINSNAEEEITEEKSKEAIASVTLTGEVVSVSELEFQFRADEDSLAQAMNNYSSALAGVSAEQWPPMLTAGANNEFTVGFDSTVNVNIGKITVDGENTLEEVPTICAGDKINIEFYNLGEQPAVNKTSGNYLYTRMIILLEDNSEVADGYVTMYDGKLLGVQTDAELALNTLFTVDENTLVTGDVAEGAHVQVTFDPDKEPLYAKDVTVVGEKTGDLLYAQGEISMILSGGIMLMTENGEMLFDMTEADVSGDLIEGSPASIIYRADGDTNKALTVTVDSTPVPVPDDPITGDVTVFTLTGVVRTISRTGLYGGAPDEIIVDGDDGMVYTIDCRGAQVNGDMQEGSRVTMQCIKQGEHITTEEITVEELYGPEEEEKEEEEQLGGWL